MAADQNVSSAQAVGNSASVHPQMRQLAACPECSAQFDVTELATGARFRCSCGQLVKVPQARTHEAAVVRCSSCGGPRQDRLSACAFCGADFTLHERDLHTICPGCASRISDKGRFCHSCGLAILVQGAAGVATELSCPACGESRPLSSRRLGGERLTVLECNHCAGLWLGSDVFRLLEERSKERQTSWTAPSTRASEDTARTAPGARMYRPCPTCGNLMNRQNYGRRSGVILDSCGKHGLWFDHGELETILRWVRDGGLARADHLEHEKRREEVRASSRKGSPGPPFESAPAAGVGASGVLVARLIERLLDFLLDLRN